MKLSQFKFKLPEELIALYPHSIYREFENDNGEKETFRITRRDECRLMVLHKKSQTIEMYKKDADGNPIDINQDQCNALLGALVKYAGIYENRQNSVLSKLF